jgi:hypothetical protein
MSAKKPQIVSCGPVASLLWSDLYWAYVIEYLSEEMKFILKKYPSFPKLNPGFAWYGSLCLYGCEKKKRIWIPCIPSYLVM